MRITVRLNLGPNVIDASDRFPQARPLTPPPDEITLTTDRRHCEACGLRLRDRYALMGINRRNHYLKVVHDRPECARKLRGARILVEVTSRNSLPLGRLPRAMQEKRRRQEREARHGC